MRDVTFGQYYPTNSPIHKLDSRAKIIFTFLYILSIFFVVSYVSYAVVALFLLTIILMSKIPLKMVLKSIKGVMFLILFTVILNLFMYKGGEPLVHWWIFTITAEGIDFTIKMALRLFFLIIGTSLLTFTTTPMELTDGIESLMKPLKYIKFPVHDFALIMSIALRFIPTLIDETDKIMMAQKSRGAGFDTGGLISKAKAMIPVLIPLFVSAFRKAEELADALDARCYNASPNRVKMKKLAFTYRDLVALFVMTAVVVFIFVDKYYIGGIGIDKFILQFFKGIM
ncbi:MAG: energy-coupling factor transporter transmembrane component T [Clostridia bacterium]